VLLSGDHNTIEGNTIKNQITASPVYGTDGSGDKKNGPVRAAGGMS
jgi:hypothetical protein